MSPTKESILKSIVALGSKVLPQGARLILFGSQARGDAHDESDWDLLILLEDDQPKDGVFGDYGYPFVELGWEYGTSVLKSIPIRNGQAEKERPFMKISTRKE